LIIPEAYGWKTTEDGTAFTQIELLTVEKGALLGKNWQEVIVSKPTEITDTIIKGDGWQLKLNKNWELIKIGKNYTLKKKSGLF